GAEDDLSPGLRAHPQVRGRDLDDRARHSPVRRLAGRARRRPFLPPLHLRRRSRGAITPLVERGQGVHDAALSADRERRALHALSRARGAPSCGRCRVTWIRSIAPEQATGGTADVYQRWRTKTGRDHVSNYWQSMGLDPAALDPMLALRAALMDNPAPLTTAQTEAIALVVSAVNGC